MRKIDTLERLLFIFALDAYQAFWNADPATVSMKDLMIFIDDWCESHRARLEATEK